MSECCTTACESETTKGKPVCPVCAHKGTKVGLKTMLQHIKQPWSYVFDDTQYYFCSHMDCDVIYFSERNIFRKVDVRTTIGIKEESDDTMICFCFGVSKADIKMDKSIKDFVITQTKQAMCACETANPSGRCCLKDFFD